MATSGPLISIVDDDPSVLRALKRLLGAWAYPALTYGSAREFLAALPHDRPNCLIIDLHMPEMNGLELQHHLKRLGIHIPTIVITAHDEDGARQRCKSAGAVALLSKPVQDQALLDAIESATRQQKG